MDIQDTWNKALKHTKIIRGRAKELHVFSDTKVPYIFLSEAIINAGDTVVRKGEINIDKPAIILPSNAPQFEGFDFEEEFDIRQDIITNFLLVRGISFPSMKYNNKTSSFNIDNRHIDKAVEYYSDSLAIREDVHSGLIIGPEECWQFSLLIFICTQVARSANNDIRKYIEFLRNNN